MSQLRGLAKGKRGKEEVTMSKELEGGRQE